MKVVFFGSPAFAVPTLSALVDAPGVTVVGVVTQPDRRRGRGQKVTPGAVRAYADAHGLRVLQPARLADPGVRDALAALGADLGVVAAYGKILPAWLLAPARLGHVQRACVAAAGVPRSSTGSSGDHGRRRETGVTIMRVVLELDAGPMLDRVAVPIDRTRPAPNSNAMLARVGAALLVRVLERLRRGPVVEDAQDDGTRHLRAKITKRRCADGLAPAGARAPQSGARPAAVAARLHVTCAGRRLIVHRSVGARSPTQRPAGYVVSAGAPGIDVAVRRRHGPASPDAPARRGRPLARQHSRRAAARRRRVCDLSAGTRPPVIAPARRAALDALAAVASGRRDLGEAIDRARRDARRSSRRRAVPRARRRHAALAVAPRRGSCRAVTAAAGETRPRSARLPLRLAAYQLLFLNRVPASAVVNDAVALVRAAGKRAPRGSSTRCFAGSRSGKAVGCRRVPTGRSTPHREQWIEHLAVDPRAPGVARGALVGASAARVRRGVAAPSTTRPPPVTLRGQSAAAASRDVVAKALAVEGVDTEPTSASLPWGLRVVEWRDCQRDALATGLCLIQDEGSQLAGQLAPVSAGALVLDVCGAPGGKTLHLRRRQRRV